MSIRMGSHNLEEIEELLNTTNITVSHFYFSVSLVFEDQTVTHNLVEVLLLIIGLVLSRGYDKLSSDSRCDRCA